jgi:hypothetical protein
MVVLERGCEIRKNFKKELSPVVFGSLFMPGDYNRYDFGGDF